MDIEWAEAGSASAVAEADAEKALPVVEEDDISAAALMLGR
jgi:hypothetical protein